MTPASPLRAMRYHLRAAWNAVALEVWDYILGWWHRNIVADEVTPPTRGDCPDQHGIRVKGFWSHDSRGALRVWAPNDAECAEQLIRAMQQQSHDINTEGL